MKRLVTQFDDERTRATVATPSCCGCCCCCCCYASVAATSLATALTARDLADRAQRPPIASWLYAVVAGAVPALALGLALAVRSWFGLPEETARSAAYITFLVAWPVLLFALYAHLRARRKVAAIAVTIALCGAMIQVEAILVIIGALAMQGHDGGWIVHVVLAAAMQYPLVRLLRLILGSLTRSAPS